MTQRGTKKRPAHFPTGKEKFIQWIWEKQLITGSLLTEDFQRITIVSAGRPNSEDGPDFKDAVVGFHSGKATKQLRGDVEIHISANDWYLHNHHKDPKYNNVILHIITKGNAKNCLTTSGIEVSSFDISKWTIKPFPALFKDYKKESLINRDFTCKHKKGISFDNLTSLIESQGLQRFEQRKQKFKTLAQKQGTEQAIYCGIMESLGYVRNEESFAKLATLADIEKLKHIVSAKDAENSVNIIKTALLGTAGLLTNNLQSLWEEIQKHFPTTMTPQEWQLFKVRPRGFPSNRINGISHFLADTLSKGLYNSLLDCEINQITKALQSKSLLIGENCARTITLNVCLPFMANTKKEAETAYRSHKALPKNHITNYMKKILWKPSKKQNYEIYQQGLIHIYHNFCKSKSCNTCPVKLSTQTTDRKLCKSFIAP